MGKNDRNLPKESNICIRASLPYDTSNDVAFSSWQWVSDKLLDILYPLDFAAEKEHMFLSLANDKLCFMVEEKIGRVGLGGYFEKASQTFSQ